MDADDKLLKKVLIISPHFPPSNLAAVHRSRLFALHLPSFGWCPVILTVDEAFYEEALDPNLVKLLPPGLRIEKVNAMRVTKPRIAGDIGLRGFFSLYKRAKAIVRSEQIDFVFIPIPSFYVALLGRWLHASTGVRYGIDYIDPWVHVFPGSDKMFSRHWLSTQVAKKLEPIAVKKASLITGVADGYYKGVQERNPHLASSCVFGAMPYGGELSDHEKVKGIGLMPYVFSPKKDKVQFVYAGAMLPKAYGVLEAMFEVIRSHSDLMKDTEFHFIGTGKRPDDPDGFNIKPLAVKYGLWGVHVFEYPKRIPYLDVLVHLEAADAIFILGSTEAHYTPSKVYQGVLSRKPVLALLHEASSAGKVLSSSGAGMVLSFNEHNFSSRVKQEFPVVFRQFESFMHAYDFSKVRMDVFFEYSAFKVTEKLSLLLNEAVAS